MMKQRITSVLEWLGVDWLPEVFGHQVVEAKRPWFEVPIERLNASVRNLSSTDEVQAALAEASEVYASEAQRIDSIEAKSKWLYTAAGLPSAVTLAAIGYCLSFVGTISIATLAAPLVLLSLALVSLLFTALLSWKSLHIHDYIYMSPSPSAILWIGVNGVDSFSREKIKDLYSATCNQNVVANTKGTYLGGAQKWFRNSVALVLVSIILISLILVVQVGELQTERPVDTSFGYPGVANVFDQDPESRIIEELSLLGKGDSVGLALCYFSDATLRTAVLDALLRGASIRLIIEGENQDTAQDSAVSYEELASTGGFQFRTDQPSSYSMHHKYMVVQGEVVVTGSYNWSDSADRKAWENILIVRDRFAVDQYWEDFERLWTSFENSSIQTPSRVIETQP